MKKIFKSVFCIALCTVLAISQTAMAETLYVNSGTGQISFNDSQSHDYTNAIIQGSKLKVTGQSGSHCSIVLTGTGQTFDVKGGTVELAKGRVAEKDKNSGQTFKMNAGSLVMTADSQIQMSNFQMKTNDDPSKSASVSLNECSNGIDVTNEAWIEKGNVTLKKSKIKAKNDFRMTGGSITATEAKVDGGKEVILRQEGSATGGTITLKDGSTLCGDDVNMSAGNVTLSSNSEFTAGNIFAFSAGTISATNSMVGSGKTFNFSGGTLDSNVAWIGARGDESAIVGDVMTCGTDNITNGTYNINGGKEFVSISDLQQTNALLGSNIAVSGGTININEGSYLYTVNDVTFSGGYEVSNISSFSKGTINLTDSGKINLAGCLVSDVSGNNTATIDFTSSNGKIEGNVSGVNINVGTNNATVTNATFGSGSSLGINIASKTNYGSLTADTINITEGAKLNLTIDNGVLARDESADFTLLNAGTITGNFTKIAQNSRYEFTWNTTDEGKVTILGVATPGDIVDEAGGSKNNEATANAWDTIDTSSSQISEKGKEVADILNTLSQNATDKAGEKAYIDALTAVAPDATPSMQQTVSETANQIFTAVGTRLSGGSIPASSKQGISGGDFEFKNVAVWIQGLLNKAKYDTSKPANNFDSNSYGMALGIESYIVDDIAKAGLGYAYSGTNIDGYLRETDVKTNAAIIYGEYKPGNWFINGVISYCFSDYSETKKVSGTTVKADWKVNSLAAQVMTGYDVQLENNFMVIPEAGLRYVNINQDSYKDSADQEVSSHTGDILTGVIGGRINKTFKRKNGLSIVPEFKLAATYDLKNDDGSSTVTLANRTTYSVTGENLDKFGIETGIGVSADVTEKFIISLGYEGKFIKDYQDHTGLLNLKYKF